MHFLEAIFIPPNKGVTWREGFFSEPKGHSISNQRATNAFGRMDAKVELNAPVFRLKGLLTKDPPGHMAEIWCQLYPFISTNQCIIIPMIISSISI